MYEIYVNNFSFAGRLLVIMDETVIDMGRLRHRRQVRRAPNYTKGCTVDLVRGEEIIIFIYDDVSIIFIYSFFLQRGGYTPKGCFRGIN